MCWLENRKKIRYVFKYWPTDLKFWLRPCLFQFVLFFFFPCLIRMHGFLNSRQYSVLVFLLILVEGGCAAFIFFDSSWKDVSVILLTFVFKMLYFGIWLECERSFLGYSNWWYWRLQYDIWLSGRELGNCQMGCSWDCYIWGKHWKMPLAFEIKCQFILSWIRVADKSKFLQFNIAKFRAYTYCFFSCHCLRCKQS